jgi:hypothetical protein
LRPKALRSEAAGKLTGDARDVVSGSVYGSPQGPELPPFGEAIHATAAFRLALTWEEATEAAKHPSVDFVRSGDSGSNAAWL